jgi:DNA-binding SARP family transcriptional activator
MLQPDHFDAIHLRARVLMAQGQVESARALLQTIKPEEGASRPRWWLHWWRFMSFTGGADTAWTIYETHSEMHDLLLIEDQAQLAYHMVHRGLPERAEAHINALLKRSDLTPATRVFVMNVQGSMAIAQNQFQRSLDLSEAIYKYHQDTPNPRPRMSILLLSNRGLNRYYMGLFEAARQDCEEASKRYLERGFITLASRVRISVGEILIAQGLYAEAEHALLEARTVFSAGQKDLVICEYNLAKLYLIWHPTNANTFALKHARAATKLASQGALAYRVSALFWLIQVELKFGAFETVLHALNELEVLTKDHPNKYLWHWAQGMYLSQSHHFEAARQHLNRALRLSVNEYDGEHQWMQLELHRVNNDIVAARVVLETCRRTGFMAGVTLALRYFPQLADVPSMPAPVMPMFRVNVLGSLQIVINGVTKSLRGAKRKRLVALLLEAQLGGRNECKYNELIEVLYPNSTDGDARDSIKQLVFQWRNQYGADSIVTTDHGYAFGAVSSDAAQFFETGETTLWRGAYLEDIEESSALAFETVREALYDALKMRIAALVAEKSPAEAARIARIVLEAEPFDSDVLALALRALHAQGSYSSLSRIYKRSRETWLEVGERLPERWSEFLGAA